MVRNTEAGLQFGFVARYLVVILSEAKDLHFAANSRSFASLRMTIH